MALVPRVQRLRSIGKALEKYLKKAHDHSMMMDRERAEFERGKRHLANIMGWDPNQPVKQDDIDTAIQYLFPSGLTNKLSLPMMKPPDEIMPKFRHFEFDDEGRPKDSLFYTLRPKFYSLMSECGSKARRLLNYHDERAALNGFHRASLQRKLGERVKDDMYEQLIIALEHLCSMPNAHFERDFIMEYRSTGGDGKQLPELFGCSLPSIRVDPEKNKRFTTVRSRIKATYVDTTVTDAGTGKFTFNGYPYSIFRELVAREMLMAPLILTDMFNKIDVEAKLHDGPGGTTATARAIRHGISMGLAALYPEFKLRLRFAGYLNADPRSKGEKQDQSARCSCQVDLEEALSPFRCYSAELIDCYVLSSIVIE
ncbi:hypothetical protein M3Y97_00924200 [Aphelenchoides bicaudatus]|nr:hypothetical protein M3Y97_00924200 [Aphelenchoides bicaudatus]